MYHYLSDDLTGESASHREFARAIWLELLPLQRQTNGSAPQAGRTLYYLATLQYRDWLNAFESLVQKKQAVFLSRTADYKSRRENYDMRFDNYKDRLNNYDEGLNAYKDRLAKYDAKLGELSRPAPPVKPPTLDALSSERGILVQEKKLLNIEMASLIAMQRPLDAEFEAAKASVSESTGKIQEDLLRTLDEAGEYLKQADELLVGPHDDDDSQADAVSSLRERISSLELIIDEARRRTTPPRP
jgi:chromosome segregation ATPase